MKVVSTNISQSRKILWKGNKELTGIFKKPVANGIYLGETDVQRDAVMDRKYHGGVDKACYLFSADVYDEWKEKFPDADWSLGMFGENLTVEELDERDIFIGDQYRIGEAIIEVSEPREPCYKLGIRFGTQSVLKSFINQPHCGVYVRVLQAGKVVPGDEVKLIKRVQDDFSMARIYWLRYNATLKHIPEVARALKLDTLATSAKRGLGKRLTFLE
ncbi:MOSC domain-containing protein [Bacteroidia bacterium]|nr:MOSC domain-containing protein [Bacteroidia bacterium]